MSEATAKLDPARGGYFTVQDKGDGRYDVRGYTMRGELLLHTWHIGAPSMRLECDVWNLRGATERRFDYRQDGSR